MLPACAGVILNNCTIVTLNQVLPAYAGVILSV